MKKKLIALTLLAVATGALTASCSPTNDSNSSAGGDDTSVTEVWATRVKISQPDTLVVGESFKISDIVQVSLPNATAKYSVAVTSASAGVISLGDDNNTVTVIGAGTGAIQLKGQTGNVLGQINITAMTENGKALQEWCDGLSNNFLLDATWSDINTVWAEAADEVTYESSEGMGLMVTENYVVDGTYGAYSAVSLDKADGDCYGFNLLDSKGNKVDYSTGFKTAVEGAASVELDSKVSSLYLTSYFVMDGLLNVQDYTEGDDGYFTLNDGTTAQDLIGTLFGMNTSNYTGVSAKVKLDNDVLVGTVKFDYKATAGQAVDFRLYKNVSNAVLETAVVDAEPPAKLDVSDLATSFATFGDNFVMNWQMGVFNSKFQPVTDYISYYKAGSTYYTENSVIYAYGSGYDTDAGDFTTYTAGGYTSDGTGIKEVSVSEDNVLVEGAEYVTTNYQSVYDIFYSAGETTLEVLNGADLTLYAETTSYKYYTYDPSFDDMGLFATLEGMLPLTYKFAQDEDDISGYCMGRIANYGSAMYIYLFERVGLGTLGTGYMGYICELKNAGAVNSVVGAKTWEAFPNYFSDPAAGGDSSSGDAGSGDSTGGDTGSSEAGSGDDSTTGA